MRSTFTLKEVAEMLEMSVDEVEQEINTGYLSYSFQDGEKQIALYDLEKYMGTEQTKKITEDYLSNQKN